ncbi:uncharacterized protein LOC111629548 [Centruroides sculpturatus]|uniref:uncharacterized protein LOC111629548 n=1 Tax=Centruroides sculpturatus TaxID=218467 RepID=UPI000C6E7E37|nr:uncharacterized protein LOC111629548 [Centruroides sculpturatus]XP_023229233.1 uncharacterized protein LOC111629548 [Centruroides sculpturatus]
MHTGDPGSEEEDAGSSDPGMSAGRVCGPVQPEEGGDKTTSVSTVCRALFGPTDHDKNRQFVRRELALQRQKDRETWNFDFDEGVPLTGRYDWTPVARPYASRSSTEDRKTPHRRAKSVAGCSAGGVTQTRIPEYMKKRKQTGARNKAESSRSVSPKAE